jgi:hypothetical protein
LRSNTCDTESGSDVGIDRYIEQGAGTGGRDDASAVVIEPIISLITCTRGNAIVAIVR